MTLMREDVLNLSTTLASPGRRPSHEFHDADIDVTDMRARKVAQGDMEFQGLTSSNIAVPETGTHGNLPRIGPDGLYGSKDGSDYTGNGFHGKWCRFDTNGDAFLQLAAHCGL